MLIFLYGQDTYRSRQKLNEMIDNYKKANKSFLNLKFFEEKEADFEEIKNETRQASIISGKKMLVLKNVFSNPGFKEKFLKEAKNFADSEDLIIFYEEKDVSKTDSLFKILKKSGKSQEFKLLEGQNLKNWIKKEFIFYGVKTELGVVEKLINYAGNDSWQLSSEIKKLASYKKNKTVDLKDIELLVVPKIETYIFKTIDALADKNKKQALILIHKHLEKGEEPLYLLKMINFQFRNLVQIKSLVEKNSGYQDIDKAAKLHPFVVKKTLWQAKKFSMPELKKIYQKIFKADFDIKTGKMEARLALDLLILEM